MAPPLKVGAVLYDPKVSVIWEIIRDFFASQGVPMDVTFYSTYALQVSALLDDAIQIAWNSPLAWLDAQRRSGGTCRAIAMRDTDRDRVSYLVTRKDGPVRTVADLRGRSLAVGASDSPQATLIPLGRLRQDGLEPRHDVAIKGFDVLVGKHGDHVGGELDALRWLQHGRAEACAMLDLNWQTWIRDSIIDPNELTILALTVRFDHCVFTARGDLDRKAERQWLDALFTMRYDVAAHREMMDLEGLKAWLPGRTTGFQALASAVAAEHFFDDQASDS
jgi:ABC-type phosphate/phosphonate transport system substrate-binding protein